MRLLVGLLVVAAVARADSSVPPSTKPPAAQGPDRDGDGIPDVRDKCPDDPETWNGFQDEDGCPDRGPVRVIESRDYILDSIFFPEGDALLAPQNERILDEVAEVLRVSPEIARVVVQGHRDGREAKRWPDLGRRRAEAAAAYLRRMGIAPDRLRIEDRGARDPLGSEATARGRAKNRRVEWRIEPSATEKAR